MEQLLYQPPKAVSYGHAPRTRGVRKGWELSEAFLREHTVTAAPRIRLWTLETHPVSAAAHAAFGTPAREQEWFLPPERLPDALAFAFDEPQRKAPLSAFLLSVWYDFTWRGMPDPGQGNELGVLILGRRTQIQPIFRFAAPSDDRSFVKRLRELEAAMPFEPRDSFYYRVVPKKSGPGERLIKLPEGWKDSA